jgi:hypothetical protein
VIIVSLAIITDDEPAGMRRTLLINEYHHDTFMGIRWRRLE